MTKFFEEAFDYDDRVTIAANFIRIVNKLGSKDNYLGYGLLMAPEFFFREIY